MSENRLISSREGFDPERAGETWFVSLEKLRSGRNNDRSLDLVHRSLVRSTKETWRRSFDRRIAALLQKPETVRALDKAVMGKVMGNAGREAVMEEHYGMIHTPFDPEKYLSNLKLADQALRGIYREDGMVWRHIKRDERESWIIIPNDWDEGALWSKELGQPFIRDLVAPHGSLEEFANFPEEWHEYFNELFGEYGYAALRVSPEKKFRYNDAPPVSGKAEITRPMSADEAAEWSPRLSEEELVRLILGGYRDFLTSHRTVRGLIDKTAWSISDLSLSKEK